MLPRVLIDHRLWLSTYVIGRGGICLRDMCEAFPTVDTCSPSVCAQQDYSPG